jgi:hypothetical protein
VRWMRHTKDTEKNLSQFRIRPGLVSIICILGKVSNFGFSPYAPATTSFLPLHYGYK